MKLNGVDLETIHTALQRFECGFSFYRHLSFGRLLQNDRHLSWIQNSQYYNIRHGENYEVTAEMLSAKYLVLYGNKKFEHTYIYELDLSKSKLMRDQELISLSHPYPSKPSHNYYFVYKLKRKIDLDAFYFDEHNHIIKSKLAKSKYSFLPFTVSLYVLAQIRLAE